MKKNGRLYIGKIEKNRCNKKEIKKRKKAIENLRFVYESFENLIAETIINNKNLIDS